ncbi:hypothetical protein BU23DRAFT_579705 [Bimuria novae-zelandiae CBS 107.79]|uniref:Integrase catalytic domain-containing protein n=1 Tax=Bimuria novae-zelandiae CBS 107.79 TaxID=1447943 RepID=A0A6A5VB01_9PLEO|nr:hypothetical protein BU23DRAFT_579705 [Bimuria novae-zelandiae CBS 107.79]
MDTSTAGKTSIKFGKGSVTVSIGTAQIPTEIGKIDFEVLDAPTPFLLCLADMDRLKVYFNNTTDELLYRRFRHLAITRLARLLKDASYNNFKERTLNSAPRRFKFTFKDNYYFNYKILVDVMYLRSKPILYIINTYQGPLDILTHDAGTNFVSAEFRAEVKIMGVICKQVPTEAHWSNILYAKLTSTMSNKAILQMAVKAINNIVGPNSLVLTLLVFGAYLRITIESPLLLLIVKRSEAI